MEDYHDDYNTINTVDEYDPNVSYRETQNYSKGNQRPYQAPNPFTSNENEFYYPEWEQEFQKMSRERNASLRWNAALKNTVENMPSKTLPRSFTRKQIWLAAAGSSLNIERPLEQHAKHIADRMEQDPLLMDDSPLSEQLRQETIRDMPQCLTIKRLVRKRLTQTISRKSKHKPLGLYKRMKYRFKMQIAKLHIAFKNFMVSFELWYSFLKQIEGNFGSGVATYFKFLRWLFVMNLLLAIPAFGFLVVPQLLYVHVMPENINNYWEENNATFQWHNIFSGEGYFTNTLLYYGYYTNETVTLSENLYYNMPQAYILTMICLYIAAFVALSISTAWSYRRSFIETKAGLQNVFAQKVFCGWDYNIATRGAAELKSSALYNEFKELLSDLLVEKQNTTCMNKVWTRTVQVTVNLGTILLLMATGFVMWILMTLHKNSINSEEEETTGAYVTAIVINLVLFIIPILFASIIKYENYKNPRFALYVTLVRTFLLELTIVGVLLAFWLTHSENNSCWETNLGQEIYRLILFDFLVSVVLASVLDCSKYFVEKCFGKDDLEEFNIARHTLQVIYNQTLFWVGFYFSPLLPIVVVVKLWLTWYIKIFCTTKFCKPSATSWRAAQTNTLFLILTFLTLFFSIIMFGYIMIYTTSSDCGPFRQYSYMYQVITEGALDLQQDSYFWQVLMFFTTPGVIAVILIAMCTGVYFLRAKAHAQREMVKILRNMLVISAKDKEFLLNYISRITAQQWERHAPSSSHNENKEREHDKSQDYYDNKEKGYDKSRNYDGFHPDEGIDIAANYFNRNKY